MYLLHDALLVVVAQRTAQLVVVHGRTVLLHTPQPRHLGMGEEREKEEREEKGGDLVSTRPGKGVRSAGLGSGMKLHG